MTRAGDEISRREPRIIPPTGVNANERPGSNDHPIEMLPFLMLSRVNARLINEVARYARYNSNSEKATTKSKVIAEIPFLSSLPFDRALGEFKAKSRVIAAKEKRARCRSTKSRNVAMEVTVRSTAKGAIVCLPSLTVRNPLPKLRKATRPIGTTFVNRVRSSRRIEIAASDST
ncbi:MAG: hypothetical protein ACE5IO_05440 [Thermoplasmata archaeon]